MSIVSGCSIYASAYGSVCVSECMFVHMRVCTASWWRCSSYIICISLPHSDGGEGGSCRLLSHLQPAEASLLCSALLSPDETQLWLCYAAHYSHHPAGSATILLSPDINLLSSTHQTQSPTAPAFSVCVCLSVSVLSQQDPSLRASHTLSGK